MHITLIKSTEEEIIITIVINLKIFLILIHLFLEVILHILIQEKMIIIKGQEILFLEEKYQYGKY